MAHVQSARHSPHWDFPGSHEIFIPKNQRKNFSGVFWPLGQSSDTQTSHHRFASGNTFADSSWAEPVMTSLPRDDRAAREAPVLLITPDQNKAALVTQSQQQIQDSPLHAPANARCPTLPRCADVSRRDQK